MLFLDHPETDSQAAIWHAKAGRKIVVAFRGTEQVSLRLVFDTDRFDILTLSSSHFWTPGDRRAGGDLAGEGGAENGNCFSGHGTGERF